MARLPALIGMMGAHHGAGVTTLSFNLAAALLALDKSVEIIEGELGSTTATHRLAAARRQSVQQHSGISPIIHQLQEATQLPALLRRLIEPTQRQSAIDFILIDLPSLDITADSAQGEILELLDQLILVTTAQRSSFHATTERLWRLANQEIRLPIGLLINRVKGYHESQHCFQRLQQEVTPALRSAFDYLGCITCDNGIDLAMTLGKPVALAFPDSPAALNLRFLVSHKLQHLLSTGRIDRLLWSVDPMQSQPLPAMPVAATAPQGTTAELQPLTAPDEIEAEPSRPNSHGEQSALYRALRLAAALV